MKKVINVGGKELRMRASALIPRLYRYQFKRDMIQDMNRLRQNYNRCLEAKENATEEERNEAMLDVIDLEIFENVAWLFMKNAGEDVGNSPDEWLDSFEGVFDVYEIMPDVLELWGEDQIQTSSLKKARGLR